MSEEEIFQHTGCMKCAIWDVAAKEHGKRGMCGDCFDMNCISIAPYPEKKDE